MLLAWDTSSDRVTVALHDGNRVVGHRTGVGARRHAEVLTPLVGQVLADAGVDGRDLAAIVVGVGPGAYTGLRVGLVTAQALGASWAVPVRGGCSLDVLAFQAVHEHERRCVDGLLVVTEGGRRQVFWARYTAQGVRVSGPTVSAPADVEHRGMPCVGSGALAHRELFPAALEPSHPDAGWLARGMVDGRIAEQPVAPLYLRQPDVTVAATVKPVLQPSRER